MASFNMLYSMYERRIRAELERTGVPKHVGVILDGNRRWAKSIGATASHGHRAGAGKISEFLEWADEVGIDIVTLWMLSTDNLSRDPGELEELMRIISRAVASLAMSRKWRLSIVGDLDLLPDGVAADIRSHVDSTKNLDGMTVNVAVAYGGRYEIAQAVRDYLQSQADAGRSLAEVAQTLSVEDITAHMYTRGQPDPDLVIRTSGEQRLSGFMLWQSVHSEFYFTEAYWPDFRRVDFLRALRSYAQRERRLGK